ncbi:LOW QUALITY PROTEIN: uncharacterized protein LOC106169544 [Lingula anatina]|uniref:LOW QUALITY PROTEIN: uncharacterized protein LOC106169544 n=1 Tax=Lingula anatina TaxID=7574 RepID=A0A1S3J2H8_LINAN|nr:LOW QUALITY PROTEIN: uncharacterized protein LOC106169544 [Lingula anatina]|eukprot:XP_013404491.1 LOW QUALITY PROTEIN: uncharacterized protein LOC106169544 [Lingula anatina]
MKNIRRPCTAPSRACFSVIPRWPLDELPMSQSLSHIQGQMAEKRRERYDDNQTVKKAHEMSETLRSYGKEMFNYAVEKAATEGSNVDLRISGKKSPHSGPTKTGSPIYNKKPELMNAIRTRPKSESIHSTYNHQRSKTQPSLQQYISKHNKEYNLVGKPGEDFDLKDTKFVPINLGLPDSQSPPELPQFDDAGSDNEASTIADELMPELEKLVESEKDIDEPPPTLDENENEKKVIKTSKIDQSKNTPTEQVKPKLKKQESVSKEDTEQKEKKGKKTPTGKKSSSDNNRPSSQAKSPVKGSRAKSTRPSSKLSKQSTQDTEEEEDEEDEEEEPRPYFHCWVDDITVSSVQGDLPGDADGDLPENPINKDEGVKVAPDNLAQLEEAAGKLVSMVNGGNPVEETLGKDLTKDGGATPGAKCETEQTQELPDYVCRISERKSKEIAIKEWIESTSFSHASKSMPLV